jgi:hypothetical protein
MLSIRTWPASRARPLKRCTVTLRSPSPAFLASSVKESLRLGNRHREIEQAELDSDPDFLDLGARGRIRGGHDKGSGGWFLGVEQSRADQPRTRQGQRARQVGTTLFPIVRNIFKAPEDADVRAAIDPILMRLHTMAAAFSDFAGHFIRQKLKR